MLHVPKRFVYIIRSIHHRTGAPMRLVGRRGFQRLEDEGLDLRIGDLGFVRVTPECFGR